jgi:hypothetical protein
LVTVRTLLFLEELSLLKIARLHLSCPTYLAYDQSLYVFNFMYFIIYILFYAF